MDITRNGSFMYNTNRNRYTKTGQLISDNSEIVVLDKNSPVIQFESDYVKSKIVNLFGGKVIPGEITEQEAELVDTYTFRLKAFKLFFNDSNELSFNELKYFKNITYLPNNIFYGCKLKQITYPKNLTTIGYKSFYRTIFTNTDIILPDTITKINEFAFSASNITSLSGTGVTEVTGPFLTNITNLITIDFPNLKIIHFGTAEKFSSSTVFYNIPNLKSINFQNLEYIELNKKGKYNYQQEPNILYSKCPNLEEIVLPKLNSNIRINTTNNTKLKKLILGNKINSIYALKNTSNDKSTITDIQYGFDKEVTIQGQLVFNTLTSRYNNNGKSALPFPVTDYIDLSNTVFRSNGFTKLQYLSIGYSIQPQEITADISTETFDDTIDAIISGFRKINIVKSNSGILRSNYINNSVLKELTLCEDIHTIKTCAISGCCCLEKIKLPDSLTTLEDFALYVDKNNYINDSQTFIGFNTYPMKFLQELKIPKNVKNIGVNPFFGQCQLSAANFTIDPENKYFTIEDGVLYNKNKTRLIFATHDAYITRIPDTVEVIDSYAFYQCDVTNPLSIPGSVKKIGYKAFDSSKFSEIIFKSDFYDIEFVNYGKDINNYEISYQYSGCFTNTNSKFITSYYQIPENWINYFKNSVKTNPKYNSYIISKVPGTLYSSDYNVQVPLGVKAYTYKLENGQYVKSKTYNENQIIPKGEPIVLEGQPDTYKFYTVNYTSEEKDKNNILVGTESDIETNVSCYIFDNGTIEISSAPTLIKENTVYIKKDDE